MDVEEGNTTQVKGQAATPASQVVIVNQASEGCQCTAGWVLFGIGWVVPLCWLVGVFLPLCTKKRQDKRAAIGSGVMIVVYGVVLGLVLGLVVIPMIALANATLNTANNLAAGSLGSSVNLGNPGSLANALGAMAAAAPGGTR